MIYFQRLGLFKTIYNERGLIMDIELKTVTFGGYDKKETLFAVNRLQDEIYALEQALNAKKLELPYTVPAETELAPIRHAMAGGFSEKDTNAYFDELFAKISDLRAELGEEASAKDE